MTKDSPPSDALIKTGGMPPRETYITIDEFAAMSGLSRRHIYRLRSQRPEGFPAEYELGIVVSKYRRSPRFKLAEVLVWLESRALW